MRYRLLIIATLFTGCSLMKGVQGNPEPNMKTIHMACHHFGYTAEQYKQHPDYDCRERR